MCGFLGGELITGPGCIARLAELDEEKAAKKQKKGPALKAGSSGVSITIRPPTAKPAQCVSGGTLDGFVSVGANSDIPEAEESTASGQPAARYGGSGGASPSTCTGPILCA